ncbi:MAG: glycerol-3-phosphate dehydrogenase [Dehalococcoidales bacterium]|jgi:glycerol-3-phosphate dehydrogenase (NAD(P)+)|nr:glycerol-3-phosphate dehydrogenase [Dehalococcoidales bacterium]|tara:strand:- start:449 stop:1552 length:1104 start_codon:yes stop_codon:yes gene_type:complete
MSKIAIIGTTTWGVTLGVVLANKGIQVRLWARTEKEAAKLRNGGSHPALVNGIPFPSEKLLVTSSLGEALDGVKMVIVAVPSQSMRQNIILVRDYLSKSMLVMIAAKGLEVGSNKRMSQVVAEEIGQRFWSNICVLSGPNLAREIIKELPAATVVAAESGAVARVAQRLLTSHVLCVFTNTDIIGVELGGALKNIIALGAGMADGLGYGDNAKAAFMTRGLTEVTALGIALGANPLTFSGLAGLGDLMATCASPLSRNHYVGVELAKGRSLEEITASMTELAEGVTTTVAAQSLARQLGLEMPITDKIYKVLYEGVDPRQAAAELMGAVTKHELAGRRWKLFSFFRHRSRSSLSISLPDSSLPEEEK